ncbi:DM13 domain-containing protein [Streptomyces sp. AP-93]|uniref:DM13 domain-containing protein n=1 Tax=Streptomyces sp. AP-93 TaxID=2929048 RepID=UPI001FAED139|nr:DM13 domain-containing protein [Streptomyces sp. AP-93]MCJ0872578.1 DM13 domain-containing protein [Streptomyces sp. AP-93]
MGRGWVTSRPVVLAVAVVSVAVIGVGLYLFQPWKLWQDETVREALPSTAATASPGPSQTSPGPTLSAPVGPQTVSAGQLISHEHTTTGAVKIVRLADGSHTLRLENLDTSNGPDLHVWLTDAPVKEGKAGWEVFDDGKYVSLGKLKGNKGNKGDQNYVLPADVDLSQYTSVSIWCDRFNVSFGAAALAKA